MKDTRWTPTEAFFIFLVVIIVIGNFFLLSAVSVKNNTISKNRVRATQLVQKRIQAMLAMQEHNDDKLIDIDNKKYSWSELFNMTFLPCSNPYDPNATCSDFILSNCPTMIHNGTKDCITNIKDGKENDWKISNDIAPYSQKIRIIDIGPNMKKITALIWWYDLLGLHKSIIIRELQK